MRLLLDEQLSPAAAEQLRRRGHDVIAVADIELSGVADEVVLAHAIEDRRAIVTNDIRDLRLLHARYLTLGTAHYGIVLVPTSYRLRRRAAGSLVKALDELLTRLPAEDALRDTEYFL